VTVSLGIASTVVTGQPLTAYRVREDHESPSTQVQIVLIRASVITG